jgi:polysaccharide deacetylase 2 family uncharacterized protein YibQ
LIAVVGIGALVWSRTDRGQAALLQIGADALYGEVQARVDSVLVTRLPAHAPGDVTRQPDPDAHDWPAPEHAAGAAIRCRVTPVGAGAGAWWQVQSGLDDALRRIGARVLWGERLARPGNRRAAAAPDERHDLLRLDVGVPGRTTHTLLLYREPAGRPEVRWGGDPAATAWRLLRGGEGPLVAIVIDDWGYRQDEVTRGLLDLPVPFTMSVLPGLSYSRRFALAATELALPPAGDASPGAVAVAAEAARRRREAATPVTLGLGAAPGRLEPRRREVMLHLPMESVRYPDIDPGPDAVLVGMDREAIADRVDRALAALPHVRGVNNHQGSAATAHRPTMEALMDVLRARDLFFLDSLTSSRSVAYETALAAGLPAARNRIFLDDDHRDREKIRARLATLVRSARASGAAVGIGHPHPGTLEVLRAEVPRLAAEGVRFVTISELLALAADAR